MIAEAIGIGPNCPQQINMEDIRMTQFETAKAFFEACETGKRVGRLQAFLSRRRAFFLSS
jgi:hypothetical protein